MSDDGVNALYLSIMRKLARGPAWARSFQQVKPLVQALVNSGYVERCAPEGSRTRNMIQLTEKGERVLAKGAA